MLLWVNFYHVLDITVQICHSCQIRKVEIDSEDKEYGNKQRPTLDKQERKAPAKTQKPTADDLRRRNLKTSELL